MNCCENCDNKHCATWRELQRAKWELGELYRLLDELDGSLRAVKTKKGVVERGKRARA